MPKVSVIIPVYNVEKYLRQCLDSVINQTLSDIEIICVNDCSTDNSLTILKEYAQKDNRIKIIEQKENQGQGIARNIGLDISQGEYIGFVDPDDWIEKDMYLILYNSAIENNADFVQCDYERYFDKTGQTKQITALRPFKKQHYNIVTNKIFSYKDFKEECFLGLWNLVWTRIYKKELIDTNKIKFSKGKYGEDKLFSIHAKLAAKRILYINKFLYHYRVRRDSACHNENLNAQNIINDIKNMLETIEKNEELKIEFDDFCIYLLIDEYKILSDSEQKQYLENSKNYLSKLQYKKFKKLTKKLKYKSFLENIFSVKNDTYNGEKIFKICGLKLKLRRK